LAIRTKALRPRASQKDRVVRSSNSNQAWAAMAQPLRGQAVGGVLRRANTPDGQAS
jgi:hypothetical protein